MGISQWELSHPDRLAGYESELIPLSSDCKLLLVSPDKPQEDLAVMFERVLKSIKLDLSQALPSTTAFICCGGGIRLNGCGLLVVNLPMN